MKLRKPGQLSAADRDWIRHYQTSRGAKIDGTIGRQTLDHIKIDLAVGQLPDDPGAPNDKTPSGDFKPVTTTLFGVLLIAIIAGATAFLLL